MALACGKVAVQFPMQASSQEFLVSTRPMQHDAQFREQHKHSLAVEVLRDNGRLRLAARGHSMLPTLWPGDVLTIEAHTLDHVRVGDVVLFTRTDRFFIHRILRKCETSLVTRGDAMPEADDPVSPAELLGKVVSVQYGDQNLPVTACSTLRRMVGLMLTHSDRMRGVALRWHAWRSPKRDANSDMSPREVPRG